MGKDQGEGEGLGRVRMESVREKKEDEAVRERERKRTGRSVREVSGEVAEVVGREERSLIFFFHY